MANLRETATWETGIYQFETSDPVMGGENGIDNKPTRQLANRTLWLKTELANAVQNIGNNKTAADSAIALKANRTIQITAGAGLAGGGDLTANRAIALATPSTLSGSTSNWVGNGATGHTHQLAAATATVAGVVKLINTLDSTAVDAALTAAKGKELAESIVTKQQVQDMRLDIPNITPSVTFQDATPDKLPVGIYEGLSSKANLNGSGYGAMKVAKFWHDASGSYAIYREGKLPNGEVWRQYPRTDFSGWNTPFRVDGTTFANIRDKPSTFLGYGISGNQTLVGSIELSGNYPSLTLKSTATGATKKWLFEAGSGGNAYFVRRDNAANTGGDILHLPQRAGTLAVNEEVVKLTENQDIAGVKTFTSAPKITGFNTLSFGGWYEGLIFSGNHAAITLNSRYAMGINGNGNAYFFDVSANAYAVAINYAAKTLIAYGDVIVGSHRLTQKANATEVVRITGDQAIAGLKTFSSETKFTNGVKVTYGTKTGAGTLSVGADDVYIHNSASNKFLQLKDNGLLSYSNQLIYHEGNKPTWADLGYTPVQQGGGTGQSSNIVKIGWSGTRLKAQVDNVDLGNIVFDSQLDNAVPSGTLTYFLGTQAPSGWLKANGAALSRTVYAKLFAAIGTLYGAGNGSTTFNIPDLRGEFLRVWDDGRGVDGGRVLGSWQGDELRSHNHGTDWGVFNEGGSSANAIGSGDANRRENFFNLHTNLTGGNETRPRNVAVTAIIKI